MRTLIQVLLVFMAMTLLVAGGLTALERQQAASWPAHAAVITQSRLGIHSSASQPADIPFADIEATLVASGERLPVSVALGRWLGGKQGMHETAEQDIARYPTGRLVTVYRSPDNPERGILEQRPWQERLDLMLAGAVLLLLAALMRRKKT